MAMSADIYYRGKLLLLLIFLPLSMTAYGSWQHYRSLDTIDTYILQLKRDSDYLKHTLDTGRKPTIRLNSGQIISPSAMLRRVEREISLITTAQFWLSHITYIPCVTGLAAALMGGLGILSVQRAGRRALQSRQVLLESFQKGLEYLPWLVGAFGLLIALGLCALLLYELSNYAFLYLESSNNGIRLLIVGAIGCGALLLFGLSLIKNMFKAAHASVKSAPRFLLGTLVGEAEAPKVWVFVLDVAEKARTVMPDAIVLGLNEGFFVTQAPMLLSDGQTVHGRILYLPLPYMQYLSQEEAATIIGHELAHFTGQDTEYSLRFSPLYTSAVNNLRAVVKSANTGGEFISYVSAPVRLLGECYLNAFHRAVQHWSRERELAADQTGAIAGGNVAVALSLLHMTAIEPFVALALAEFWDQDHISAAELLAKIRETVDEYGFGEPTLYLEECLPHPMDSHPTTRQRIEAVGLTITPELLEQARTPREHGLLEQLDIAPS